MDEPKSRINWVDHVPLIIGAATTLFVGISILSIAHFNYQTAYGILQAGGTAAVIVGAILSEIGFIAVFATLLLVLLLTLFKAEIQNELQRMILLFLAIMFGLTGILTAQIGFLVITAIVITMNVFFSGVMRIIRKMIAKIKVRNDSEEMERPLVEQGERTEKSSKQAWVSLTAFLALYCGLLIFTTSPWYPAQELIIKNQTPETVYVLSTTDTEMAVLVASTRQIEYYPISDVLEHQLCNQPDSSWGGDSLPQLIIKLHPAYATCP